MTRKKAARTAPEWFIDHESTVFSDAGYLINEGGGIRTLSDNKRKAYIVSITEKTPLWLRLTASGPAGHASDPPAETAVTRLVRALERLSQYQTPIHVIGPVQDYYHTMAELDHGPKQQLDLVTALKDPAYLTKFLDDPSQNAHVRDTITPTVLSASNKTNVISATAYAEIDCRLLPGSDPKAVENDIKKADRRRLDQNRRHPELPADFFAIALAPDDRHSDSRRTTTTRPPSYPR